MEKNGSFHNPEKERFSLFSRVYTKVGDAIKNIDLKYVLPAVFSIGLGYATGKLSYNHECYRESKIPLGFSEIAQVEREIGEKNLVPSEGQEGRENEGIPFFYYLAGTNDLVMKILECSNEAHAESGDFYWNFSEKLKARFNAENKKHRYELADLFEIVPESIKHAKSKISHFYTIKEKMPSVAADFDNSWTESHRDKYHTEVYPTLETYTDADGDVHSRVVMKTKEVYDYTNHSYNYHREEGERASSSLESLIKSIADIRIKEKKYATSRTNPEGERAAIESRIKKGEKKEFSKDELMQIANTWQSGSTIFTIEPQIYSSWEKVVGLAENWRADKLNARDHFYRNLSHSDSGPKEYQTCKKAERECKNVLGKVGSLLNVIEYTGKAVPELNEKIKKFIEANGKEKRKLGSEVLDVSKELYSKNFSKGFDVLGFRGGMVALFSILGAFGGAIAGVGTIAGLEKIREGKS